MDLSRGLVMKPRTRVGTCPYINGPDGHHRIFAAGILAHVQGANGLEPGNDDQKTHDKG